MNKKALLINGSYLPTVGGVENSLRSIANELLRSDWDVDIVCSNEGIYNSIENINGVNVYRFKKESGLYFYNALKLVKTLKNNNYQLVICRNHTLFFVLFLLGFKDIKYIIPGVYYYQNKNETNNGLKGKLKYSVNVLIQTISFNLSKSKYVFSETMKKQVDTFTMINKNLYYSCPGVDVTRFHSIDEEEKKCLRVQKGLPLDKKIVLGVGRFVDVKNFEHLISCISYLPEDYIIVLVGGGENKLKYIEMIDRLDAKDRVIIISNTIEPEVYYKTADVFCLPSTYEPFGQVLLEASSCKLNIVAFDSNVSDIDTATTSIFSVVDSTEFYFPVLSHDIESFADAIINASLSDGAKTEQEKFNQKYSWANLIENISHG